MDQRPIGVFDSGVGGLSVVRELCRLLPGEDIVYFGDVGRVPYGTRSREVIYRYASEDLRFLRDRGVKLIVAACGTASSVIDSALTDRLPMPYTGVIEPTARAAAAATRNKTVGIIGTDATIRSGSFVRALQAIDPDIHPVGQGCALLVPLVENGYINFDNQVTRLVLEALSPPDPGIGCRHPDPGLHPLPAAGAHHRRPAGRRGHPHRLRRRHRWLYPRSAPADRPGKSPC